jgi:putative transposase
MSSAVVEALRFRHDRSARILTYCIMPDHIHLLLSLLHRGRSLSAWVGDLKRWMGRELTIHWQPGFYEHIVRKQEDVHAIANYILANPVRAGLAESWRKYGLCGSFAWEL